MDFINSSKFPWVIVAIMALGFILHDLKFHDMFQ